LWQNGSLAPTDAPHSMQKTVGPLNARGLRRAGGASACGRAARGAPSQHKPIPGALSRTGVCGKLTES
jgi:hypothetical protein